MNLKNYVLAALLICFSCSYKEYKNMKKQEESELYFQNKIDKTPVNLESKPIIEQADEKEDETTDSDKENSNRNLKEEIKKFKKTRLSASADKSYLDTGSLYIPPQGAYSYGSSGSFDLLKWILVQIGTEKLQNINEKITEQDEKIQESEEQDIKQHIGIKDNLIYKKGNWRLLALLGDTGAGKSVFTRYLEKELWKRWKGKNDYFPLWVSLPSLDNYKGDDADIIGDTLSMHKFTDDEINDLADEYKFFFILDGYDELMDYVNLYDENALGEWEGSKTLISSRIHHFNNTNKGFQNYLFPEDDEAEDIYMAPFTNYQLKNYFGTYTKLKKSKFKASDYLKNIECIGGLKELVKLPLRLRMIADVLPRVIDEKNKKYKNGLYKININDLYDSFLDHCYERELSKPIDINNDKIRYSEKDKKKLKKDIENYCMKLAKKMHGRQLMFVNYKNKKENISKDKKDDKAKEEEWSFYFGKDKAWLRRTAPLTSTKGDNNNYKWQFWHKSLLSYYKALATSKGIKFEDIEEKDEAKLENLKFNQLINDLSQVPEDSDSLHFFSNHVNEKKEFENRLWKILNLSKTKKDNIIAMAALNAIAILNRAEKPFNYLDLSDIIVSATYIDKNKKSVRVGPNLMGGLFCNTILDNADLRYCKLENSWLQGARLCNTNLTQAFLDIPTKILNIPFGILSPNKQFLTYDHSTILQLYDTTKDFKLSNKIIFEQDDKKIYLNILKYIFSPDSKHIYAICGHDKQSIHRVNIQDNTTKELTKIGDSHAIACNHDSTMLAIGDKENIILWNIPKNKKITDLKAHKETIKTLTFDFTGKFLISSSNDGTIVWSMNEYKEIKKFNYFSEEIEFTPDDKKIVTLTKKQQFDDDYNIIDSRIEIKVYANHNFSLLESLTETGNTNILKISPNGKLIFTGSNLRNLKNLALIKSFNSPEKVEFLSDTKILGLNDTSMRVWSLYGNEYLRPIVSHNNEINSISFNDDGKLIFSASSDKTIKIWDSISGRLLKTIPEYSSENPFGHRDIINGVVFLPKSKELVTSSKDGTVKFWNTSFEHKKTLTVIDEPFNVYISVDKNESYLVTNNDITDVNIYSLKDYKLVYKYSDKEIGLPIKSCSFNEKDLCLAAAPMEWGKVTISNILKDEIVNTIQTDNDNVENLTFSPNNKLLALLLNQSIVLYSYPSCELHKRINTDQIDPKTCILFNRDSKSFFHSCKNMIVKRSTDGSVVKKINHSGQYANTFSLFEEKNIEEDSTKKNEVLEKLVLGVGASLNYWDFSRSKLEWFRSPNIFSNLQGTVINDETKGIDKDIFLKEGAIKDLKYVSKEKINEILEKAIKEKDDLKLKEILKNPNTDINCVLPSGGTPLTLALAWRDDLIISTLLNHKQIDVNKSCDSWTPLLLASESLISVSLAEKLVIMGADVNSQIYGGMTPLHYAVNNYINDKKVITLIKLLLQKNADTSIKNSQGETPLDIAKKNKLEEVAKLIAKYQKSPEKIHDK